MSRSPQFERCTKTEAANALRNAAGPREFGGPDVIRFGLVGTTEIVTQKLTEAIMNITVAHDQGWLEHPRGFDLVVSVGRKVLRYEVKRKKPLKKGK